MKHKVAGHKLGRNTGQRNALLKNLSSDLLLRGYIVTTLPKAKLAQSFVEKSITDVKKNRLFLKRRWAAKLSNEAFLKLINNVAPGFSERQSGFTRITKMGIRKGDAAQTAKLEFLAPDKVIPAVKAKVAEKAPKGKTVKAKKTEVAEKVEKTDEKH